MRYCPIGTTDEVVVYDTRIYDSQGGSSLWSDIWNSPIVRAIVPDEIGLHLSATAVPVLGFGTSRNYFILTRGKDAGFHTSQSVSLRAGEEAGLGISVTQGWYIGAGEDVNLNSLMGAGADINGELGPINAGIWTSIDTGMVSQHG